MYSETKVLTFVIIPEFTLIEIYQAYTDYNGMMDLTEGLFRTVAQKVVGTTTLHYGGYELDFSKPFERLTMVDAVKKYAGIDFNEVKDTEAAQESLPRKRASNLRKDTKRVIFLTFSSRNM